MVNLFLYSKNLTETTMLKRMNGILIYLYGKNCPVIRVIRYTSVATDELNFSVGVPLYIYSSVSNKVVRFQRETTN